MLTRLRFLVRNLFRRRAADRDLVAELDAFRAERPAPGAGPEQWREQVRAARAGASLETLARDLRLAARSLRKSPGLTLACVLTLALGMGAITVVFSLANAFLFRPLPVPHPEQLQFIQIVQPPADKSSIRLSADDMRALARQGGQVFSQAAYAALGEMGLSVQGEARPAFGAFVTAQFFALMGVQPARGQFFTGEHDAAVVLSYDYWQSRFHGDPAIVGSAAIVQGRAVTIAGVAPRGFHGISQLIDCQVFAPVGLAGATTSGLGQMSMLRLRADISGPQAANVMAAFAQSKHDPGLRLTLVPMGSGFINSGGKNPLYIISGLFLALAGMVLLLAAANVAGLLLARAATRQRELAVRAALGAGRLRLARQALLETLLLAALGALAGLALAVSGARAITALPTHSNFPVVLDLSFDWHVYVMVLAATLVVAAVAGIVPAWRSAAADPNAALGPGRGGGQSRRGQRLRSTLVTVQVAGSLALLIISGLFVRSMVSVENQPLGFQATGLWNYSLNTDEAGYDTAAAQAYYQQLLPRVRALPGVASASYALAEPFGLDNVAAMVRLLGSQAQTQITYDAVSAGYFSTMGMRLMAGRGINDADAAASTPVAVVSTVMARQLWPHQEAIGQFFISSRESHRPLRVVGVVANAVFDPTIPSQPLFYTALAQDFSASQVLQVRVMNSEAITAVARAISQFDPKVPFSQESQISLGEGLNGLFIFRLGAELASTLGLLGLLLAVVGVYGVVANAVVQRTHEMGVRIALGARPSRLVAAIARRTLPMLATGFALGLGAAAGVGRAAGAFLIGVSGLDPLTFAAAPLLLAAITAIAVLLPALAALRADPLAALRCE